MIYTDIFQKDYKSKQLKSDNKKHTQDEEEMDNQHQFCGRLARE